jgi:hypothetical protein
MSRIVAGVLVLAALSITSPAAAKAANTGRLALTVTGLPKGERAAVTIKGPGTSRRVHAHRLTLRHARAGRYVITTRRRTLQHTWRGIKRGAIAFPQRKRLIVVVHRGRTVRATTTYGTIVNPGVSELPPGLVSLTGEPTNPSLLIFPASTRMPGKGSIVTSAPSELLPNGLVAEITDSRRVGAQRVVSVRTVPVSAAVPAFDFQGEVKLATSASARTASKPPKARAAAGCDGPKDFDVGAKLDEFTIRHASAKLFPPQMSFTIAVRTTERAGPRVAAAGVSCTWSLGKLGPWHGSIPTPIGVPVPVYAQIPLTATVAVEGSLSAFRINLASTSVLSIDLGSRTALGFWEEGSNVWVDGALQFSGKATIATSLDFQMGVGSPEVGDLHVSAGFGATARWTSGRGCDVDLNLGRLSAGVKIGPLKIDTPPYSPFTKNLWHGCDGADSGGTPGSGTPGSGTPGSGTPGSGTPGSGTPGGGTPGGGTPSGGASGSVSLAQGPAAPAGYRYAVTLSGWPTGASVSISCRDSRDPGGFFTFTMVTDGAGNAATQNQCYSSDGPDHWVVANGTVESNHVSWGGSVQQQPPPPSVWHEQEGSLGANTFTNPYNASGMGPKIGAYAWVDVSCKVYAPQIVSANPDGYWYRIASPPWNNAYYAVANTFWNGDVPGQKPYTHNTDWAVPNC